MCSQVRKLRLYIISSPYPEHNKGSPFMLQIVYWLSWNFSEIDPWLLLMPRFCGPLPQDVFWRGGGILTWERWCLVRLCLTSLIPGHCICEDIVFRQPILRCWGKKTGFRTRTMPGNEPQLCHFISSSVNWEMILPLRVEGRREKKGYVSM